MSRVTQSEMIEVFRVDGGLSTMVGCNRKIGENHETYIEVSLQHVQAMKNLPYLLKSIFVVMYKN